MRRRSCDTTLRHVEGPDVVQDGGREAPPGLSRHPPIPRIAAAPGRPPGEPFMRTILTRALGALLLAGGAACSDPSGIETATPVAAVTLSAASSTLLVGEALV